MPCGGSRGVERRGPSEKTRNTKYEVRSDKSPKLEFRKPILAFCRFRSDSDFEFRVSDFTLLSHLARSSAGRARRQRPPALRLPAPPAPPAGLLRRNRRFRPVGRILRVPLPELALTGPERVADRLVRLRGAAGRRGRPGHQRKGAEARRRGTGMNHAGSLPDTVRHPMLPRESSQGTTRTSVHRRKGRTEHPTINRQQPTNPQLPKPNTGFVRNPPTRARVRAAAATALGRWSLGVCWQLVVDRWRLAATS